MKKILILSILALLVVIGSAYSANIPTVADPKSLPIVWTESVYNGSGSNIGTGQVVIWDFETSDSDVATGFDDMCNWVTATSSAQDVFTAGVTPIDNGISNGERGIIIIKGPAVCDDGNASGTLTANDIVALSSTDGEVAEVSAVTNDEAILGVVIKTTAAQQGDGSIYDNDPLIYIDISRHFDD